MKIIQQLVIDDSTLIFTETPEIDILEVKEKYKINSETGEKYMGYEMPILTDFKFLGKKYPCISFWHDNEDVRDIEI